MPPALTNTFTINELEIQDSDNAPAELIYTLVTLPQHGILKLNNVKLTSWKYFYTIGCQQLTLEIYP
ncbi:MAG: hypothetical protein IPJ74_24280 [Saprospiraceae bacterium]|nr:hypothetical protein [Saprospiraceae bacterium]